MNIDSIINSDALGITGFDKDFYALVGSSIVLFGITYYMLVHYLEKIDPMVNKEDFLGTRAGRIIDKVKAEYKDREIKFTGDWYDSLVHDRNKIAHGFIVNQSGKTIYYYKLEKSKKRPKGEEGELDEQFFLDFIANCNMFIGTIVVQDSEMKEKYGLFKEIK